MPMTDMAWLRKLLDDEQSMQAEIVEGDAATQTFMVRNPPVPDSDATTVTVAGQPMARGSDFIVSDGGRSITLLGTPPGNGVAVVIRYPSQLWTDDELETYLAEAALKVGVARTATATGPETGRQEYLYRAGVMAIDTLLSGTATGLNFGAGSETFDVASVFQRLMDLRKEWLDWLARTTGSDDGPEPVLAFVDIDVDLGEPGDGWIPDSEFWP
jgi:hypothetical protein